MLRLSSSYARGEESDEDSDEASDGESDYPLDQTRIVALIALIQFLP